MDSELVLLLGYCTTVLRLPSTVLMSVTSFSHMTPRRLVGARFSATRWYVFFGFSIENFRNPSIGNFRNPSITTWHPGIGTVLDLYIVGCTNKRRSLLKTELYCTCTRLYRSTCRRGFGGGECSVCREPWRCSCDLLQGRVGAICLQGSPGGAAETCLGALVVKAVICRGGWLQ